MSSVPAPDSDLPAPAPAALASRLPQAGAIIAEKYRIEAVLGSGAMGCVVAAQHLLMQRRVAIKFVLGLGSNPNAVQRFFREARVTQSLQDEHVVRVYDLGVLDNGTPYLVMEYLEGRDLGQVLKHQGKLPTEDATDYILAACQALAEAHASGIVHRDIKPSNLLLTLRRNGTPLLKVVDFGISKLLDGDDDLDASLTGSVSLLGSPLYMSPEQVRSAKSIDERSDVWALGVTLYALLTARAPFQGDGVHGVCAAIVADPPAPFQAADGVPEELQALVLRCLIKRPEERVASVNELAAGLAPFASKAGQLNASRIEALYGGPAVTAHSAWQPELAIEETAAEGDSASGIASAGGGTLNNGTAQTLVPQPAHTSRSTPRRRALALAAALGVVALGLGVRQLLTAEHAEPTAAAAASANATGSGPLSAGEASAIESAAPAAEPPALPEPAALRAATPSVAKPETTLAPRGIKPSATTRNAPSAAKPGALAPKASEKPGASAAAQDTPAKAATDDDGFVIPD